MPESSDSVYSYILMLENIIWYHHFTSSGPNSQEIVNLYQFSLGPERLIIGTKFTISCEFSPLKVKRWYHMFSSMKKKKYKESELSGIFRVKMVTKKLQDERFSFRKVANISCIWGLRADILQKTSKRLILYLAQMKVSHSVNKKPILDTEWNPKRIIFINGTWVYEVLQSIAWKNWLTLILIQILSFMNLELSKNLAVRTKN